MKKRIEKKIILREDLKQLKELYGELEISAFGYNELNKIAGVSILSPETIVLPSGDRVGNPYILKDENDRIREIWTKEIAFGYAPSGNLVLTSTILIYNPFSYLLRDIMKEINDDETAGRVLNKAQLTENDKKTGYIIPVNNNLVICANLTNIGVIRAVDSFVQNQVYGDRVAQTICKRNALKQHPALNMAITNVSGEDGHRQVEFLLTGWIEEDTTKEDILNLVNSTINQETFKAETVEIPPEEIISTKDVAPSEEDWENKSKERDLLIEEIKLFGAEKVSIILKEKFPNRRKIQELRICGLKLLLKWLKEKFK